MQKVIVYSHFENDIIFFRLIEDLKKMISLIKNTSYGLSFIILKINEIRLKVTEESTPEDLKEQFDQMTMLYENGSKKALEDYYRGEGIWD